MSIGTCLTSRVYSAIQFEPFEVDELLHSLRVQNLAFHGYTPTRSALEADGNAVLVAHYGDLVKYVCKTFFGWDGEKDEKGRTLLQKVGTDAIRAALPEIRITFIAYLPFVSWNTHGSRQSLVELS